MKRVLLVLVAAGALVAARPTLAQEMHSHSHGEGEDLGEVHFPTSCRAEVEADFTRAVALLHSFGYEESRRAFEAAAEKDPACGMAYWGIAMTYYHPVWSAPNPAELGAGRAAAEKAAALGGATERERAYIDAINVFYRDSENLPHAARATAYEESILDVSRRFPDDHEATIFYALLLCAPSSDPAFVRQKKGAAILNGLLPVEPRHPGITHYMIHAFDYPPLASEALPAARSYAKIAPASPHALHMPSHIFTRLGLWQESIASNIASADAARRLAAERHPGAFSFDAMHALDYLEYAYLQIGDDAKARAVFDEAVAASKFDEAQFAAGYGLLAIPARWTLERRDWKGAADLRLPAAELPWDRYSYAPATTYFAQAVGAARSGQLDRARAALGKLKDVQVALASAPPPGYDWPSEVEAMRLAAAAWIAYGEGRKDEAVLLARAGADLEDKTGKHPVTPGSVLPARELLADLLLAEGRPADALREYEVSLREAPARFNSLVGAARAAEQAKEVQRAREYWQQLLAQSVAGSKRPEIAEARRAIRKAGAA